jgi:hypothetical protein
MSVTRKYASRKCELHADKSCEGSELCEGRSDRRVGGLWSEAGPELSTVSESDANPPVIRSRYASSWIRPLYGLCYQVGFPCEVLCYENVAPPVWVTLL